jgi:hypothetical protein
LKASLGYRKESKKGGREEEKDKTKGKKEMKMTCYVGSQR